MVSGFPTTCVERERGLWDDERPLWGAHGWDVYGETVAAVERAIRYVNENPLKEGKDGNTGPSSPPFCRVTRYR